MARRRVRAVVSGRVQGVGFRYFVCDAVVGLPITGTVRNLRGGDVEVVAEGSEPALERLIAALREGPRVARIASVDLEWSPATGEFTGFRVTY